MAILITTNKPHGLLAAIKAAIDAGAVKTWEYDKDGDFTHALEQWRYTAWLRPSVQGDSIIFRIFPPRATTMSRAVYAVYHGHFVEMLLTYFDTDFSSIETTALPAHGDVVKSQ
jgi:hypothetical protein